MLCINGDMFVKLIVTFPAFAVSELSVNFSCPLGSAASVSVVLPAAAADVDGADEDAELELLLELLELPHAATASAITMALSGMAEYLDTARLLSLASVRGLSFRPTA